MDKCKKLQIRLTDPEQKQLQEFAESNSINISEWVRKLIFREIEKNK